MRMHSGAVRQGAYLWPCSRCGTRNGLNAQRCWHCEDELPPPCADALIAAWNALAPPPSLPDDATAQAPLPEPSHGDATADALQPVPAARLAPPDDTPRRTIEIVDLDIDDEVAPPSHPVAEPPRRETAIAVAETVPGQERFGQVADGGSTPATRRQRLARMSLVGAAFVGLVVAGYPIYRGTGSAAVVVPLRHAALPPLRQLDARLPSHPSSTPVADIHPVVAPPRVAAVDEQQVRPAVATSLELRPAPANVTARPPVHAAPAQTASLARRPSAHTHAPVPMKGPTRMGSARGAQARSAHPGRPVLVAGEVSMHDAAIGR
jgi:hypothetical protein